ncbi:hypothetical protein V1477_006688 [Vespula maculifrons]|uniref:Uncharacterized protein n=1 Tax=Vespula maculifrons TaxID=7453 RepID=A0ABD2CJI6_VESMC
MKHLGEPDRGHWKVHVAPSTPIFFRPDRTKRSRVITHLGEPDSGHWKVLVAPSTHIFFRPDRTNRSQVITHLGEPCRGHWKVHVAPCTPIFFRPDRTKRSRVITHLGERGQGHWKVLVAPSTPIFFRPYRTKGSRVITHLGEPGRGHWKVHVAPCTPIFFRPDRTKRSRVITHLGVPDRGPWKGIVPPSTPEPSYNCLKGTKENKHFSLTIFFSQTIAPRRTGPVSLERARRALYAHIFFVQIGPRGADTWEYRTGVLGKGSSRRLRPYFFRPDRSNRSRVITKNRTGVVGKGSSRPTRPYFFYQDWTNRSRVITEPSYNGLKGTKEKEIFSLTIFFSETIAPRKSGLGSLERALRSLHAHMFFIKIGPIGAESRVITEPSYNGLKGTKEKKNFSLTIFFSETIAPRKTGLGSLERALRALHAHMFFIKIGPIGADTQKKRTGFIGKGSSRPTRPYFFYQDQTNRSRVITEPSYNGLKGAKEKEIFSLTFFFSETIAPRKTGLGSLESALRALQAHIFFIKIGPIGAGTKEKKNFSLTIFFSETIAPRKTELGSLERALRAVHAHIFFIKIGPIGADTQKKRTGFNEPSYNGLKGTKEKKNFSLTIFFSETIAPRKTELGSLERALRAEPSYNGLKVTKEKEIFSLTIFFSETIAPRKTGLGSLERAPRALHAHIFSIKIGPIGGEKTGLGTLERALRALHAHIFFIKIGPIGADYNGLKGTKEKQNFSLTIFFSETIAPRKTGLGTLERALRALHAHIFFIKIGPIGAESRVITEPSYNGLKGTKEKQNFSLTIFFSETIAPRKTGLGSLERALRALHAHIFFIKIGPIGADTLKNRTGVTGKRSSHTTRPYFFYQDRTNRSRVITHLEKPYWGHWKGLFAPYTPIFFYQDRTNRSRVITEQSYNGLKGTKEKEIFPLTIFFSETIAPRKTGLGSLERALRALHAHIFFIKIGPIGAESDLQEPSYNGLKGTKEKEIFSLTIFFSETIAHRKTGLGSLERALRALHAHIFLIKIRPIEAESRVITEQSYNGLKGTKEKEIFPLTIFFSETIAPRKTGLGSLERALRALHAHIFFIKIGPIGADFKKNRAGEPSYNGLKGTKEKEIFSLTIFFSETIAPRKTGLGSLERALRALHAHEPSYNGLKGTKEKEIFSLTIFFSETIAPRKAGLGSLERALCAVHAHIFFIKIGPIGAEL